MPRPPPSELVSDLALSSYPLLPPFITYPPSIRLSIWLYTPIMSTFFSPPEQPKEGIVLGNNSPSDTDSHGRPQSKGKASSKPASEKSTLIEEPRNSNASNVEVNDTTHNAVTKESSKEVAPNESSDKETAVKDNAEKEVKDEENKEDSDIDGEKTDEPEIEYPAAWRLVLITIALCFCVFCVALVSDQLMTFGAMSNWPKTHQLL